MQRFRKFLLILLVLCSAALSVQAEPAPLTGAPSLFLGDKGPEIAPGLTRGEVEKRLGAWPPDAQEEYATYNGVLTVYIRHGKVGQLSAVPAAGGPAWKLRLDGKEMARLGEAEGVLKGRFGEPRLVLGKPAIEVWLYSAKDSDVALLFTNHALEALILTPAGKLQDVLFLSGYQRHGTP